MSKTLITRDELLILQNQYIKAREDKDWKERARILKFVQAEALNIFKAYGITQLADPHPTIPRLKRYIRIIPEENRTLSDLPGVTYVFEFQATRFPEEKIKKECWFEFYLRPHVVSHILDVIDQLRQNGIPSSEWHKIHEITI